MSVTAVADLIADGDCVVLSGAGLSTESGIPDYRGPASRGRPVTPMTFQTFVGSAEARRRYWARSHVGWRNVTGAQPNAGHRAVADLEAAGLVTSVITQNVDGLHQAAGSRSVIELHGNLGRVVCLDCGARTGRAELDHRLRAANRQWAATATAAHPDGDVTLDDDAVSRFRFVDCRTCGGILKPDVVFFGESVSRPTVEECYDAVAAAGSLLVLGSSLTVMSGLRFVRRAAKLGIPVVIVNDGPTRGDELATLRLHARLGTLLPILATAARDGTGSSGLWTRPGTAARVAR